MITTHSPGSGSLAMTPQDAEICPLCDKSEYVPFAGGAALLFLALTKRRTLFGLGALAGGGYLLYRAYRNGAIQLPPEVIEKLRASGVPPHLLAPCCGGTDSVYESSVESFPASDPPANY